MIYIAIDPGKVTGVCSAELQEGPNFMSDLQAAEIDNGYLGMVPILSEAARWSRDRGPVTVVYEEFTISTRTVKTSVEYDALYIIGALRYLEACHDDLHLEPVYPSSHKPFNKAGNKVLTLWPDLKSKDGHMEDAASLLIYHLVKNCDKVGSQLMSDWSALRNEEPV